MTMRRAAGLTCAGLLLLFLPGTGLDAGWSRPPDPIADAAFWRMFSEFSEPSGYFPSENLVSNERTYPAVLPGIRERASRTGAYIGVGPEQNFTYLAALRPQVAFIVDVRRQNAILHLLYKALFEMSPSRAEFLSRLFSRPRPRHLGRRSSARDLFEAFAVVPPSADLFAANLEEVRSRLVGRHGFPLADEDLDTLESVYSAFFEAGPDLRYSFRSIRRWRPFPTYADLMTATDDHGIARSFLANETTYRTLRELQQRNLIVPVVGDFSGTWALRSVASYLGNRGLTVAAFYTSNVEFYLFRGDEWRSFYSNLATLPVDRRSVLVRSVFRGSGMRSLGYGMEGRLVLDPLEDLATAYRLGRITSYGDLVERSR